MGIVLAVLEPLPQCKNGRNAGSDQCAERKWSGAAGRETATDPGRWDRRRRTLTANSLCLGFRGRFRGLRADFEGSWGRVLAETGAPSPRSNDPAKTQRARLSEAAATCE
jgi:hypothetical protein